MKASYLAVVALAANAAVCMPAFGDYPEKPVRIIVPSGTGATLDTSARIYAKYLEPALSQSVVVENRPGVGGIVGTEAVVRAAPDGYTLLLASAQVSIVGLSYKLSYDPLRDLQPVSMVINSPLVLVIQASLPAKTLKEFLDYGKANPGKLNVTSTGGSEPQFLFAMFGKEAGVQFVELQYKAANDMVMALLRGEIHATFTNYFQATQYQKEGRMRILAVSTPKRYSMLPDVPTLVESGYPKAVGYNYSGIIAPSGISKPVLDRLSREIMAMARKPDFIEAVGKLGFESVGSTPEEFAAVLKKQLETWTPVAKDLGIVPQ
jgi:tripartite-type tricarboxylate transporter receptor subunit TctC